MKHASLLTLGVGKLGDVVGYRTRNGVAVRKRVYNPKNPKTEKQAIQRAAFAAVASLVRRFGSVVNNSFDGYSNGSPDLGGFRKANLSTARAAIIRGVNGMSTTGQLFVSKGGTGVAVYPGIQISRGVLNNPVSLNDSDPQVELLLSPSFVSVASPAAFRELVESWGLQLGDQLTVLMIGAKPGDEVPSISSYGRLIIRSDVSFTTAQPLYITKPDGKTVPNPELFEAENLEASVENEKFSMYPLAPSEVNYLSIGCILTRVVDGQYKHSTDYMVYTFDNVDEDNTQTVVPTFMGGANPSYAGSSDWYTEQAEETSGSVVSIVSVTKDGTAITPTNGVYNIGAVVAGENATQIVVTASGSIRSATLSGFSGSSVESTPQTKTFTCTTVPAAATNTSLLLGGAVLATFRLGGE